jgi:hypothetical protein
MLRPVAIVCVLVGCYDPTVRDCTVTCRSADECVGGQICDVDGFCVSPSYRGRCARMMVPDGAATPDARDDQVSANAATLAE